MRFDPGEIMVPRGLEPRTLRSLAVRSNQLSYETLCKNNFALGRIGGWKLGAVSIPEHGSSVMLVLLSNLLSVENYSSFGPKVMRAKNCVLNHGAPKQKHIAEWCSGRCVGLIAQRSMDRNHAPLVLQ